MAQRDAALFTGVVAALLAASCASPPAGPPQHELAARVEAALAQRRIGVDALQLIDNMLRHEPGPPPLAPPLVRELLAQPLAAADADTLFRRVVPRELLAFDDRGPPAAPTTLDELLAAYVAELAAAQALLRQATGGTPVETATIIEELRGELPSPDTLRAIAPADVALLQRANAQFVRATARFVNGLRAAGPSLRFPEHARRFDSAAGVVSIGTRGDDRHGPDAALIVDPGGDDQYERAPVGGGGVSVIIDLGGNDTFRGSDLVVNGLSALVDFAGDDRYEMAGPGLAAAMAGAALLIDFSGNDSYEAQFFGEGAAAYGLGALLDFDGDDRYRIRSGGQGFAMAGGTGLLWDRAGQDRYSAGGPPDPYGRGGDVSLAQGAAFGLRMMLGGGVGILRDDAGDDVYEAQMFAQGTGYYYGLGMLWDRAGDDRYRAVRYAQGNGVHEAVGLLRDESGNDRYELELGVGQGMGLDQAVGVLYDAAGDDRYQAKYHAQGNATGNGIGLLFDGAGADQWHMSADPRAWGRAEPARSLPSFGLLLYEPERASFSREGSVVPPPQGGAPLEATENGERSCPDVPKAAPRAGLAFAEALRSLEFVFRGSPADAATYAYVQQRLVNDLDTAVGELPGDDFTIAWLLTNALPCALRQASAEEAASTWNAMERALAANPASPFAFAIAGALRERPVPAPQLQRLLHALQSHRSCAVRATALRLESSVAPVQAALRSSCWRLQATALELLGKLGIDIERGAQLPSFLRGYP